MIMKPLLNRRHAIHAVACSSVSTLLGPLVADSAARAGQSESAPFQRCIMLWMQGGPSQLDTFDPKPGTETGGPFQAIQTSVPGIRLCETLSLLASRAEDLCLIRSVGSTQGEHERASYLLHTGYEKIDSFPRPALGSYVTADSSKNLVPGFVTLGAQSYGPAFLGTKNGPFVANDLDKTLDTLRRVAQARDRLKLLAEINQRFGSSHANPDLTERAEQIESVNELVESPFAEAFDLSVESASTRRRYGETEFGDRVLAARRLLESGVRYVEVQMPGWDTHVGNFPTVKRLCGTLQPAWTALMDDLQSNGLWQDTMIVWMGEFGRTPTVNGQNGRDHYPQSIPVVIAGQFLGGKVIGSTGKDGRGKDAQPHRVADLMYTLMNLLGVDADRDYITSFNSPTSATDNGAMINGIL